jgi:hypothetical protein
VSPMMIYLKNLNSYLTCSIDTALHKKVTILLASYKKRWFLTLKRLKSSQERLHGNYIYR